MSDSAREVSDFKGDLPVKPRNYLRLLEKNPKRWKRIHFLGELFKSHGFQLRIAGGAVRDLVNSVEPQDIDFATDARPEETLKMVEKYQDLLRIIVTAAGQKHGTVAVKFKEVAVDLHKRLKLDTTREPNDTDQSGASRTENNPDYDNESPYEITTLRYDRITDGRHAEVEFINDWKKDAERRDLTINSMFLSLDDGKLIDYFGGERDCHEGVVRFVGEPEQRIKEDYLRILRYFRFWLRFSKQDPEREQLDAIRTNLEGLKQISGERIWQELKKIFSHLPCSRVVELMLDIRLFDYTGLAQSETSDYQTYMKDVMEELKEVESNVKRYHDEHLCHMLKDTPNDTRVKRTKDLLPCIVFSPCVRGDESCFQACNRLKFSNLEKDTILYILSNRGEDPSMESMKLQIALANASDRHQAVQRLKAFLIHRGKFDCIKPIEDWVVPTFPLNGRTVSKAIKERKLPNSKTKEVIDSVKIEWAKGNYEASETELNELMLDIVNKMVAERKE